MEADKNAKKGVAAKRAVRKPQKTDLGSAQEADLTAAAGGTDQVEPATEELLKTTRRRAQHGTGVDAAVSGRKRSGGAKPKATRRKAAPPSGTPTAVPALPPEAEPAAASQAPQVTPPVETAEPAGLEPVVEALQAEGVEAEPKSLEEPTFEQIQLRAYFIAERRRNAGLPGDERTDWTQAKEELSNEMKGH